MFYILNWKSEFTCRESIAWLNSSGNKITTLAFKNPNDSLVICPSFEVLNQFYQFFSQSTVSIGAQDCSPFPKGPFTGAVTAESLAEIGCHYCIIGHSERRQYFNESNDDIYKKMMQLISQGISPILCIGEIEADYEKGETIFCLEKQLVPMLINLAPFMRKNLQLLVAYEPRWAIGTQKTPDKDYLVSVFEAIDNRCAMYLPKKSYHLLYGGNSNECNIKEFKKNKLIEGFLIGRASHDADILKKIIET